MVNPVRALAEPESVVIASGASLSATVNLGGRVLCGIFMPAEWTAAGLSFQASPDGVTFYNVHAAGAEFVATASAAIFVALDPVNFLGARFLRVRSGTAGVPVNQGADRTLILMLGQPDL